MVAKMAKLFLIKKIFADAPTIRLIGTPQIDLEEGKDSLVLRCEADANPPASIVWRRAGRSEIASLQVNIFIFFFQISVGIKVYTVVYNETDDKLLYLTVL